MQQEIANLLSAWQRDRASEERVLADVMAAVADLASARQAFLEALDTAARTMAQPPPMPRQPVNHAVTISEIIRSMREEQPHQRGYN